MTIQTKIVAIISFAFLCSCGGTVLPDSPLNELKKSYSDKTPYAIMLTDMDLQGDQYKHQYKVYHITSANEVKFETTEWINVDDYFFLQHEDDLGMEILSKATSGKYNNLVTPPGFSSIIGNSNYGEWILDVNNKEYWEFSHGNNFLEGELGLTNFKVLKNEYELYQTQFLYNRPYYGETTSKDSTRYGTRSSHWIIIYPGFYHRRSITRNFYKPISSSSSGGNRGGGGFGK